MQPQQQSQEQAGGARSGRRNGRRRRGGRGDGEGVPVPMARALGASENEVRRLMTEGQKAAAEEKDRLINPTVDSATVSAVNEAIQKGDFGSMGKHLLKGITKCTEDMGEMGRMLVREQEAFKKEIMGLFNDVSRQTRKVILEFVSKRLCTKNGEYWDPDRMLREVNKLTVAKHDVKIPMEDVG